MNTSIFSGLTKTTSLCLGVLAVVQLSAHASTRTPQTFGYLQGPLDMASIADGHAIANNGESYYVPPNDSRPFPDTNSSSGSRGESCSSAEATAEEDASNTFAAIGPKSKPGLTSQMNPEFSWYISPSEEGKSVLFRLFQIQENRVKTPIHWKEITAQTGFMKYRLPDGVFSPDSEKDYLWKVTIKCDEEKSLESIELPIRFVPPSSELTAQLSTATTNAERAAVYGNASLWYDAFAQVVSATVPKDRAVRTGLLQDLATEEHNQAFSSVLLAILEQTDNL